jgi:hypothetical protein
MSLRSNGSYIGPRPTGPNATVASGIWDLRTAERQKRAAAWPLPSDPYFSDVSLLLHFDGNLTDFSGSPKTVTAYNSAAANGSAKYGTNALSLNGTNQYLRAAASSAYALPADFAIEAWVYLTAASQSFSGFYGAVVAATYPGGGEPNAGWQLRLNGTSTGYQVINLYTGATDIEWNATINLNQWHYLAVARHSGTIRAYLDGAQVGSSVSNSDNMSPTNNADLWIGAISLLGFEFYFTGRIDELRLTKGTSRGYTGASIEVPGQAFPDS